MRSAVPSTSFGARAPSGLAIGHDTQAVEDSHPRVAGPTSAHWAPETPIHPVMTPTRTTTQYQFSTLTTTAPEAVLDGIGAIELPEDLCVSERGSTYLVLGPRPSSYDARLAVGLAGAVVLAVLILSAFSVVLIAFLPVGVLPLVPLFLHDSPQLAVGAVPDEDGATRVTVHGQAPARLTTALDLFLSRLPVAEHTLLAEAGNGNGNGHGHGAPLADDGPVRAPETTAAD